MSKKATNTWNKGIFLALVKLFHFIAVVVYLYAINYDYSYVHVPETAIKSNRTTFGGKFKYLTFLDAIIQAIYFIIALFNDVLGTNEVILSSSKVPAIRKIKDYFFAAFAFPVAFNVGITFWALYAIDRELVFPKAIDAFFPNWLNHIMHTNIMIFIILELFTSFRLYPNRKAGLIGLSIFMVAYLGWLHVIKYKTNIWVYPILEVLNLPQRLVFFGLSLVFSIGLYIFGEFFNEQIWVKEIKAVTKHESKKAH